jgi:iron complex outermembrane receptor protein
MKKIFKGGIVLLLLTSITVINLQAQQTIILKDKKTQIPIENANFYVGKQKGQSDKNGTILVTVANNDRLIITHISYETLELKYDDVAAAIQKGWIELNPSAAVYLNPVTVYALKGKAVQETVKLGNGDWVQHDAGQVLQQIPGFSAIKKSGAFGYDPVFRGFKLDQLNILNDGALTSTAACPNRMDPPTSQVLISQVQQIEILKGPHSFRYGPSMGAVINFKSVPAEFSSDTKPFGRITTGYESNGEIYRTEGSVGLRTKKVQLTATGSYSKGHNYTDGNDSIIPARFSRGSVGLTADVLVKSSHLLKVSATRNFARNTDFPTLLMDLLSDDTWMVQGQYKITGKNKWYAHWNTQMYASFVDHKMGNLLRPASQSMQATVDAVTDTWGGRTEFTVLGKSQLFFGADMKYETADGNRLRKMITGPMAGKTFIDTIWQNGEIARAGIFGEWHHQLNQYKLVVSGRLDAVHAKANNTSAKFIKQYADNENTDINSSISAGISRQWNNKWQAGLWLGRGVRSANLTERYINSLQIGMDPYEMLGNPQLKPEANNQADVMIGYKTTNTTVQWNGYASLVSNYISSVMNSAIAPCFGAPGVRQYVSIDEAIIYGFEFSWQQQLLPVLQQQFTVAYTYGKNNGTDKPLPEIAPMDFRYRLEAITFKNKLVPYTQVRYAVKQNRIADDFGEKVTPAFTTVDLGVKTELIKELQVTLAVNNLFNEAYREHLSRYIRPTLPLNSTGRSIVLMASYNF